MAIHALHSSGAANSIGQYFSSALPSSPEHLGGSLRGCLASFMSTHHASLSALR
ncbi:hypothetical protein HMPREF0307_01081 [Corynebacterium sp. DNF00584]|nr:hypothetical protein HMPREF0307_01081 [Corynebacterium sp. DNF00584]